MSESNLKITNEWAKKNGLSTNKVYTLHPRVKGFQVMIDAAINDIDSVVDITLGYVDRNNVRCSENSILSGELPSRIVCHCTRITSKDLQKVENLDKWLHARFESKERELKDFYENKRIHFKAHPLLTNMPDLPGVFVSYIFWLFLSTLTLYLLLVRPYFFVLLTLSSVSFFVGMKVLYGGIDRYYLLRLRQ